MRQLVILIAWITALVGCATSPNHKAALDAWIGKSSAELKSIWGPPNKQIPQSTDETVLEYFHDERLSYGGGTVTKTQTTYGDHGVSTAGAHGGSMLTSSHATTADQIPHSVDQKVITWSCIIRFTVGTDGKIVHWTEQGNDCKSGLPKSDGVMPVESK